MSWAALSRKILHIVVTYESKCRSVHCCLRFSRFCISVTTNTAVTVAAALNRSPWSGTSSFCRRYASKSPHAMVCSPSFVHPQSLPIDSDSGLPINSPKVQQDSGACPVRRHCEGASVPHVSCASIRLEDTCKRRVEVAEPPVDGSAMRVNGNRLA